MKIFIAIYLICAVLSAGAANAYFKIDYNGSKKQWATKERARVACGQNFVMGILGPISLIVVMFYTGGFAYGFDWSCDNYSKEKP